MWCVGTSYIILSCLKLVVLLSSKCTITLVEVSNKAILNYKCYQYLFILVIDQLFKEFCH
jgi:hypothetical protein